MALLCPLCLYGSFTSEEGLLYELISLATRKIYCPICSEILTGFDKFTVHLCSHILKCDSNPVTLKIDDNMMKINERLENIHLQRKCEKPVNLCSPVPSVDTSRVENNIVNNLTATPSEDKNSKEVPFVSNYLVHYSAESEVSDKQLHGCETGTTDELGHFSENNFCPVQNTDELACVGTHSSRDFVNLGKEIGNNLYEIKETGEDTKSNILHVDFFNENVPITVISNGSKSNEQQKTGSECSSCSIFFPDAMLLKLHNELVHGENKTQESFKYQCHLCQNKFKIRGSLSIHQQMAHRSLCDEPLPSSSSSTLHFNSEEKGKQYFCSICFKSFKKENYLQQHLKVHEEKQWSCDECGKLFTTKYFLKKHKRLHTGEMPYSCSICDKHFTFQQSYHKHMMYHNVEKPYSCEECSKSFKELSTLYNHQRIHTGEKPYSCDTCGKHFRQRVTCLIHSRIHTGSKLYKCSQCQKLFRYKVSLRSHKCVQTNIQE